MKYIAKKMVVTDFNAVDVDLRNPIHLAGFQSVLQHLKISKDKFNVRIRMKDWQQLTFLSVYLVDYSIKNKQFTINVSNKMGSLKRQFSLQQIVSLQHTMNVFQKIESNTQTKYNNLDM